MIINISRDFSQTPGVRYRKNGKYSGEEFREDVLIPKYESSNEIIIIELDGTFGYPPSFLSEAFGGLVRHYLKKDPKTKIESIIARFEFRSQQNPMVKERIIEYMRKC